MQVDYYKIPEEMRAFKQWICWRYEDRGSHKPTKVPYDPVTGLMSSVTDPASWRTFEECVAYATHGTVYDGIGFMLSKGDPYTFIDLDDTNGHVENTQRQIKIYQEFDSYSERSPSGKGLHIIVKGEILCGKRRSSIEMYSSERYMTMTGVVFNNKPIMSRQPLLDLMWAQMSKGENANIYDGNVPETSDDRTILDRALAATNGDKFKLLLDGHWQGLYSSQSEADFAFIDIIAFYTQNKQQIARLFRLSVLGQREKAQRKDYVDRMILRAFDNQLPPIDIVGLTNRLAEASALGKLEDLVPENRPNPTAINGGTAVRKFWQPMPILPPPGLTGEIARYIYESSPRPVAEVAIATAIGFMAGICGRSYNVSGTGLNQYVCLLAPTGTGKEAIAGGISKLLGEMEKIIPAAQYFRGPAQMASGQSVLKYLADENHRSFVAILGEFGIMMQQLSNPRASSSELSLKRVILDLYNKSGHTDVVSPSIYAQKDNNIEAINNPAMTILGESTPESFYEALDENLISSGLLPRFMFIEYTGKRPRRNKNFNNVKPSTNLVQRLIEVADYNIKMQAAHRVVNVGASPEALEFLDRIDELVDDAINETEADVVKHLWNRAHIKTLKLAALLAVGNHFTMPVISIEDAQWAFNIVMMDIVGIVMRFNRGEIGGNNEEREQAQAVMHAAISYVQMDARDNATYLVDPTMHHDKVIPQSFFSRRLSTHAVFKNDRRGGNEALKRTLQALVDSGDLVEIGKNIQYQRYKFTGKCYMIAQPEKLSAIM